VSTAFATTLAALLCLAAQDPAPRATLAVEPRALQVGQPATLVLEVQRPERLAVELPALEPGVHASWVVTEALGVERSRDPARPGLVVERARWRAFALEGGAELPALEIAWKEGEAAARARAEVVAAPSVAHALDEGEDAARPVTGWREPVAWTAGVRRLGLGLAALGLAAIALGAWLGLRRRRRRARAAIPADPIAQLAQLEARWRAEPAAGRARLYELTHLVRAAVDAHAGRERAALDDAAWIEAARGDPDLGEGRHESVRALLARCERFKYAGEEPTRFAVDESLAAARALLATIDARAQRKEAA
jgi:hypothetical protein